MMSILRKNLISLVIISVLISCTGPRQISTTGIDKNIIVPHTAVVDKLGNLYFANKENQILKKDPTGVQLGYYSNNSLGNISHIDVTSPLKVLVFYPDFSTGVVLDRRLLETSRFNFIEMGFGEIDLVAFSRDGTVWIFDDHRQRLIKVNQQGVILTESEDLRLTFNERINANKMIEAGGSLYVNVPNRGILIFDLFGLYKSQILVGNIVDFQVSGDFTLIYTTADHEMVFHNSNSLEQKIYPIEEEYREAKILLGSDQVIVVRPNEIEHIPMETFF